MDNLDYIESYFTKSPGLAETREFENRIGTDPAFAEEVAYYLSVLQVARQDAQEEKKRHFKEIYQKQRFTASVPVRKLVYYIAAAAVVTALIFGLYVFVQPPSPQQLAKQYEQANLQSLGVSMSGNSDPLETALGVYNDGKTSEALSMFEKIIQADTSYYTAKKYAGIAALRLKKYDSAIQWFEALDTYTGLHSNPAKFYLALTLMERNQSGDIAKAKDLLQQVVQDDGEEREIAQEWMMKMQ